MLVEYVPEFNPQYHQKEKGTGRGGEGGGGGREGGRGKRGAVERKILAKVEFILILQD